MTSYSVRHGADVMSVPSSTCLGRNQMPVDEREDAQLADRS